MLRKCAYLAYGTMINRHCSAASLCPPEIFQVGDFQDSLDVQNVKMFPVIIPCWDLDNFMPLPPPPFGTKGGIEIEGNQIKSDQSINVYGIQSVAELHLFWMFLTNMLGASRSSMDLGLQSKHLLRLAKSMGIVSRVRISSLLYIFCHCCCTIINHSSSLPVVVPLNQRLWVPF